MRVISRGNFTPEVIAEIEAQITHQKDLQDLMNWALSEPSDFIPRVVAEVVVQDEFTHDVVIPWRDGLVLVYDTT